MHASRVFTPGESGCHTTLHSRYKAYELMELMLINSIARIHPWRVRLSYKSS